MRVTSQALHKEEEQLDDDDVQLIEEIEDMGEFEEIEEINEIEEIEDVEELEELEEVEEIEEIDDHMNEQLSEELDDQEDDTTPNINIASGEPLYTVDLDDEDSVDEDREYIGKYV